MTSGGVSFNMNEHLQLIFSFTFMEVLLRFNKLKTLPLLFRLKFTAYQESMIFLKKKCFNGISRSYEMYDWKTLQAFVMMQEKKNPILVRLNILKITFSQTTFIQSDTVRSSIFFWWGRSKYGAAFIYVEYLNKTN